MSVSFKRSERVSDLIMREVSNMIVKGEIRDPRVSNISITGIKVTDNLSLAELFYTLFEGDENKEDAQKGLESAKGFIKSRLAKRLKMRRLPDLKFSYDYALEKAYKVDDALKGISGE